MSARVIISLWVLFVAFEAVASQMDFTKMGGDSAMMAMVPPECKPTIETAKKEGQKAYKWLMNNPCKKCKAPTKKIMKYEPWAKNLIKYVLTYIEKKGIKLQDVDLSVSKIMEMYEDYKKACVLTDKTFMNHPNLCKAKNDEFKAIQECCQKKAEPEIPKYMGKAMPFMNKYCPKGKPLVIYFLSGQNSNRKQDMEFNMYAKLTTFAKTCS